MVAPWRQTMFENNLRVQFVDNNTLLETVGRFQEVRKVIEVFGATGTLKAISPVYCCYDCDGEGWWEEIAVVNEGRIWPTSPSSFEPEKFGPERTLRTRNTTYVLANYMPGAGWPDAQRFTRREGRRAARRFGKAIVAEAMAELE